MKIEKFEQSGFIIETNQGFKLAIDIGNKTSLERLIDIKVDALFISHIHGDHFSLPQIRALNPKNIYLNTECKSQIENEDLALQVIKNGDSVQVDSDIRVHVFSVDHGPNISSPVEQNFGFLINAENQDIYFAGDMFYESGIEIASLDAHFALIPVGGFYTFGPIEALNFIQKFKSIKTVIPMHYDNNPSAKDEFCRLAEDKFNLGE